MNASSFCHWLQGVLDSIGENDLTNAQVDIVKKRLSEAFLNDIDKSYPDHLQQELNDIHQGKPIKPPVSYRC